MLLLLSTLAAAEGLNFSPDRPGVGDSTSTVGQGHAMVEAGILVDPGAPSLSSGGIVGRYGLTEGVELRLRAPDVGAADGLFFGPMGVGAKFAGGQDSWSVSAVPELTFHPQSQDLAFSMGTNIAVAMGAFGLWGHSTASATQDGVLGLLTGGGASVGFGPGGAYVNGGYTFGGSAMLGAGGWFAINERVQLDAGVDLSNLSDAMQASILMGVSAGW
jgi:hypothetical protein